MTILTRRNALRLLAGSIFAVACDAIAQSDYQTTVRYVPPKKAAAAAQEILANSPEKIESFSLPRHDKPDKNGLYHIYVLRPTGASTKELVHLPLPDLAAYQAIKAKAMASLGPKKFNNTAQDRLSATPPRWVNNMQRISPDSFGMR